MNECEYDIPDLLTYLLLWGAKKEKESLVNDKTVAIHYVKVDKEQLLKWSILIQVSPLISIKSFKNTLRQGYITFDKSENNLQQGRDAREPQ